MRPLLPRPQLRQHLPIDRSLRLNKPLQLEIGIRLHSQGLFGLFGPSRQAWHRALKGYSICMSLPRWLAGFALLTAATLARADYQVTLSDVHMCCKGCVHDAKKAGDGIT